MTLTSLITCNYHLYARIHSKVVWKRRSSQERVLWFIYIPSLKKWFQFLLNYVVMSCCTGKQETTHWGKEEDALLLKCICTQFWFSWQHYSAVLGTPVLSVFQLNQKAQKKKTCFWADMLSKIRIQGSIQTSKGTKAHVWCYSKRHC